MLLVISAALAIDCSTQPHERTCEAANEAILSINDVFGTEVVHDNAKVGRRPETIHANLQQLRASLVAAGCAPDEGDVFDVVSAGRYTIGSVGGSWNDGRGTVDELQGVRRRNRPRPFEITLLDGGVPRTIAGDQVGVVATDQRLYGDDTRGFIAGFWARYKGHVGIHYSMHVNCIGDEQAALASWWGAPVDDAVLVDDLTDAATPVEGLVLDDSENSPANEGVTNAIDGTVAKYLNFVAQGSGLIVEPSGTSVVTGLRVFTANDAEDRDPASFQLSGGPTVDGPWTVIAEDDLALPGARNVLDPLTEEGTALFTNDTPFAFYRLIFPTTKGTGVVAMQVGEIELLDATDTDITAPGDAIVWVNGSVPNSPAGEGVENAVDDTGAKYLVFSGTNAGLSADVGGSVVTGLRVYTANDAEGRDPASYVIEGGTSFDGPWTQIHAGSITLPADRNPTSAHAPVFAGQAHFLNDVSYTHYRVYFPTTKADNITQIADIELLGR